MTADPKCECGCGGAAPIAPRDYHRLGLKRGEPHRFIAGHNNRGNYRKLKADDWDVQDMGYESPCWLWKYSRMHNGYGVVHVANRRLAAHRAVYEKFVGAIPEGLDLDHLCRVRHCVRPDHLEPVTRKENLNRGNGLSHKSARTGICQRGHRDSFHTRPNGKRYCRECQRLRDIGRGR